MTLPNMSISTSLMPLLALVLLPWTYAQHACLPLGPAYPSPRRPSVSPSLRDALSLVTETVRLSLSDGTAYATLDPNTTSFSAEIYSLFEEEPLWTYHYSGLQLRGPQEGVSQVDSNTVYRIGSMSKLLTVYASMVAAGDDHFFREPVTKYVPELADYAQRHRENITRDKIDFWDFESITLEALAGQLSGLPRDFAFGPLSDDELRTLGLPAVPPAGGAFCQQNGFLQLPCNRSAFFENIFSQDPATFSFHTPIYSNVNYQIFAYAIASLLGSTFPELMEEHFVRGLSLNSTYLSPPADSSTSIIPYNRTWSAYDWDMGDEAPAGGYYSTINDMRKIGSAMLNSTQLNPHVTRRWFKPITFTASSTMAVGLPWEIILAPNTTSRLWMYTKGGHLGSYTSEMILIPELAMGVSVLAAGVAVSQAVDGLGNIITPIMVPAMERVAMEEAKASYTGTYRSANGSITILSDGGPGLLVQNDTFTWNGSDAAAIFGSLGTNGNGSFEIRLWPTTQTAELDQGGYATAWRAVIQALPVVDNPLPFLGNCISWFKVDQQTYGGVGLDEFVFFHPGKAGKSTAVEPRVLRTRYER